MTGRTKVVAGPFWTRRKARRIEREWQAELDRARYTEVHEALDPYRRWPLVQHEVGTPLALGGTKDANGVESPLSRKERRRAKRSQRWNKFTGWINNMLNDDDNER